MQTPLDHHQILHAQQIIQVIRQDPKHETEQEQDQDHYLGPDQFYEVDKDKCPCHILEEGDQSHGAGHGQDQSLIDIVDPDLAPVRDIQNTEEDQADPLIE